MVAVELFGNSELPGLKTFLDLPTGIPSHDTFGHAFAALGTDASERSSVARANGVAEAAGGRLIAVDGRSICRSFERGRDKAGAARQVGATVDANRVDYGQVAVAGKNNEIGAIPRLLGMVDVRGATVTADAAGCQSDVARRIVEAGGDHVLAVKENQTTPHAKTKMLPNEAILQGTAGVRRGYDEAVDARRPRPGRDATRVWVMDEVRWLGGPCGRWAGLAGVAAAERRLEVMAGAIRGTGRPKTCCAGGRT